MSENSRATGSSGRGSAGWTTSEIADASSLSGFLSADRVRAAYAIGDLDPRFAPYARWFGAQRDQGVEAVGLLYTGLRVPVLLTLGDPDAIDALLEDPQLTAVLPRRFFASMPREHLAGFQLRYHVDQLRHMERMALDWSDWSPPDEDYSDVLPVGHADTASLMALYRHYPDHFFEPYQLETGLYFGIRRGGELVSVAGVHVVSDEWDIAAVGNVVTHPDHRSQGLSRRCTARLLTALFERVTLVTLNVSRENDAARRVYQRLGFTERFKYLEGPVQPR